MKILSIVLIPFFLCGCSGTAELFKAAEVIETDNAIKIEIQKEALTKDSNIQIGLDIGNGSMAPN